MGEAFTPVSFQMGATASELPFHRCRSRQILAVRRIFARISPNLPVKLLCNFCLQIFSHKDHEYLFWCGLQKRSSCVFTQTLGAIFEVKQRWAPLLPWFYFWGCACTPCNNTAFYNSITGNFMVYPDRLEKKFIAAIGHRENSEWFSISSVIVFEVNIIDEKKQTQLVTTFLFLIISIALNCFTAPPALAQLRRPWICKLCQQTSPKRWMHRFFKKKSLQLNVRIDHRLASTTLDFRTMKWTNRCYKLY